MLDIKQYKHIYWATLLGRYVRGDRRAEEEIKGLALDARRYIERGLRTMWNESKRAGALTDSDRIEDALINFGLRLLPRASLRRTG